MLQFDVARKENGLMILLW